MSGLLQRGLIFLNLYDLPKKQSVAEVSDASTEGISAEDQKDIRAQIEQVALENRIRATPEVFAYEALKKGSLFPIVVNIIAVVVLASGLALLAFFFSKNESRIAGQNTQITTAEGQILQEVKREAAQQIQQKDQQISDIQGRLQQISTERSQLLSDMNGKIQTREAELKAQMETQLAAERTKLQAEGVSQTEITRRLEALQQANTAALTSQMDTFRKQAEAQRAQQADNLQKLQNEYQKNLAQATVDRQQIQQQADQKVVQLQAQLQGQIAQSEQQLTAAQQQLQALQDTNQKDQLVSTQITGFYTEIRKDVDAHNYPEALKTLTTMKNYLSTDTVLQLASIRDRRPAELFIINSLTSLVTQEMQQTTQTASTVIAAASIIDQANALAAQASGLLKQGDTSQAQSVYAKALALVPGIEASHQFFIDQDAQRIAELQKQLDDLKAQQTHLAAEGDTLRARIATQDRQIAAETAQNLKLVQSQQTALTQNSASQTKITAALDQARKLYDAGQYQQSLDQYRTALSYLSAGGAASADQIAESGFRLQSAATVKAASDQAAPLLAAAQKLAQESKFAQAIDGYAQIITTYPMARQLPTAVDGLKAAFSQQVSTLQGQIASLTRERDQLSTQVASLKSAGPQTGGAGAPSGTPQDSANVTALTAENRSLTDRITGLNTQVASLRQQLSDATTKLSTAEQQHAASVAALDSAQKELSRIRPAGEAYTSLKNAYAGFASAEDSLMGAPQSSGSTTLPSQATMLKGKVLLDQFLASDQARTLFPGLLDRIHQYDRGFESSGRSSALSDVSDIVYNLSQYTTQKDRASYLTQQIGQATDAATRSFLESLSKLVG